MDQANASGITLLTVLELKPDERVGEKDNYQTGFDFAVRTAREYLGSAHYFEAGNEIDNWVGINGDGSARANYNQARYQQARGLIKGMIDGVHSVDAKAFVMVNDAGWCHYGFLHSLWDDGVRWDITAFHWYSNQGNIEKAGCQSSNVAQFHAAFGLPVWITEFNSSESAKNGDQEGAAKWLVAFIDQLGLVAEKYNVRAAFIYELLDEPNLTGMESHFGLADGAGNPKAAYKAVASKLLFK